MAGILVSCRHYLIRGGATILKISTFQIFPNIGPRGGWVIKSPFSSQIQKRSHYPRGHLFF